MPMIFFCLDADGDIQDFAIQFKIRDNVREVDNGSGVHGHTRYTTNSRLFTTGTDP